ncbi:MAG: hypothetical protein R3Y60_02385 [bacterium]
MIFYKDLMKKVLFVCSIIIAVIVFAHIIITSIFRNYMYYGLILMYTLSLFSLLIIGSITFFCTVSIKRTTKLQNILYNDCDPQKAIELTIDYLGNVSTPKHILFLKTFLTACYFRAGRNEEAVELFYSDEVYKLDVKIEAKLLWYHNFIMSAIMKHDSKTVSFYQEYFKKMKITYPNKNNLINDYLNSQDMYNAFTNNEFYKVEKYFNDQLLTSKTKCEKVMYNYYLTKINKSSNKDYSKSMEFVINNGNTLFYVDEIKQLKGVE